VKRIINSYWTLISAFVVLNLLDLWLTLQSLRYQDTQYAGAFALEANPFWLAIQLDLLWKLAASLGIGVLLYIFRQIKILRVVTALWLLIVLWNAAWLIAMVI
jgi:hypothetical protein